MIPDINQPAPAEPLSRIEDERNDVADIHAPILSREKAEPQEGLEPAPFWFITMIGALLFWGGYYLGDYNGGFKPLVFDEKSSGLPVVAFAKPPGEVDMVVLGKRTFTAMCAPCHQETGLGLPSQFPPLAGSDWVNAAGHARLVRIVLDGFTGPVKINGQPFNNTMVPWRGTMSDEQIAAVLTYVRQAWGNKSAPVGVDNVKALREKTKDRAGQPWTAELLKAVPEKE
jgi:mono/diheme cytochrome c family protein